MPSYLRFRFGPFATSQRIGRTQAQKRAAAKARAEREEERERGRTVVGLSGVVTARTAELATVRITGRDTGAPIGMIGRTMEVPCKDPAVTEGQGVHLRFRLRDWKLRGLTLDPAVAAEETAREAAEADHDARTYRGVIARRELNGLPGGSFTIEAPDRTALHITLNDEDASLRFLSLKKGDIVQVTLGKDGGLEEFWHLSRANGANPRSPAEFWPGELDSGVVIRHDPG
jgi:hypothetical protein